MQRVGGEGKSSPRRFIFDSGFLWNSRTLRPKLYQGWCDGDIFVAIKWRSGGPFFSRRRQIAETCKIFDHARARDLASMRPRSFDREQSTARNLSAKTSTGYRFGTIMTMLTLCL
jgi:hypothetical protein